MTQTIESYLRAQVSGDGAGACAQLTATGRRGLIVLTKRKAKGLLPSLTCEDAVGLIRTVAGARILGALAHAHVTNVRVTGPRARAEVVAAAPVGRREVDLAQVGSAWRITHVPGLP